MSADKKLNTYYVSFHDVDDYCMDGHFVGYKHKQKHYHITQRRVVDNTKNRRCATELNNLEGVERLVIMFISETTPIRVTNLPISLKEIRYRVIFEKRKYVGTYELTEEIMQNRINKTIPKIPFGVSISKIEMSELDDEFYEHVFY